MKVRSRFNVRNATLALSFGLAGCSNTFDVLSSQRFKEAPFHTLFHHDDPVELARKSQIADDRSKAFLAIKEPKLNGGTDAEQFEMLQILATAATSDKQPICRMRAIEALARWEDPRTAQIVLVAYNNAATENPAEKQNEQPTVIQAGGRRARQLGQVSSYTAETIVEIRCHALEAIGKKRSPEGLTLLCELASTPAKRDVKPPDLEFGGPIITSGRDQGDLRLAAIRALANYKDDMTAAQTVYKVMMSEHDVALKGRSYDTLQKITGKDFAPDSAEWATFLKLPASKVPAAPNVGAKPPA